MLLSLRFRTDKTLLLSLRFRTDKTLLLSLRFRTDKTLPLTLRFRAEQSFLGVSDEPLRYAAGSRANTMLVTKALSQDVMILAFVPLSQIPEESPSLHSNQPLHIECIVLKLLIHEDY
ncbi:hypothetical protein ACQKMI_10325 [Lysinibacillus sp. NPDC097214]|uniref:hypothetical protein n=1 Tax=Lysinibacillus sp. NPDC097214 TaxID=3390584 RepID=UPI003D07D173